MGRRCQQQGVTLVELVVAIAAGTLVVAAVASMQVLSLRDGQKEASRNASIESLRTVIDRAVESMRYCQDPTALDAAGNPLGAGVPGVGLQATCPAPAGVTRYSIAGGQVVRTDGTGAIALTTEVSNLQFTVSATGVIDLIATSQPIAGNAVVVPASVAARLNLDPYGGASGGGGGGGSSPTPQAAPKCGPEQPAFQVGFYSNSKITSTVGGGATYVGDVYANGGITMGGGTITGVGAVNNNTSTGPAVPLTSQPRPPLPSPDWAALKADAIANNEYYAGGGSIGGTYTKNGVIFYDGPVTTGNGNTDTVFNGDVTLVVNGKLTVQNPLYPAPGKSLALLVQGDLELKSAKTLIAGIIYTTGKLSNNATNMQIQGVVVADSVDLDGGFTYIQDTSSTTTNLPGMEHVCAP